MKNERNEEQTINVIPSASGKPTSVAYKTYASEHDYDFCTDNKETINLGEIRPTKIPTRIGYFKQMSHLHEFPVFWSCHDCVCIKDVPTIG